MSGTLVAATPVAESAFAAAMARFPATSGKLALAVSGGPDSMALAFLIAQWRKTSDCQTIAFIVDHGLRPESSTEAAEVAVHLAQLGFDCEVLRWDHTVLPPKMHEAARRARYLLLSAACRRHGATALLLAHHSEDQAETILMRMVKGSGTAGLSGMAAASSFDGLSFWRPFLFMPAVGKAELIATCRAANIAFVSDPSNEAQKYARGRLRKLQPLLSAEGLTRDSLLLLGTRAAEAEQALNHYTRQFLQQSAQVEWGGAVRLDKAALCGVPRAIAFRALAACLDYIHHGEHPPDYASLSHTLDDVLSPQAEGARCLAGCLVSIAPAFLTILREPFAIKDRPSFAAGQGMIWDGRWVVTASGDCVFPPDCHLAPLGAPSRALFDQLAPGMRRKAGRGRVRAGLPGLWRGSDLVAIPEICLLGQTPSGGFYAHLTKQSFP